MCRLFLAAFLTCCAAQTVPYECPEPCNPATIQQRHVGMVVGTVGVLAASAAGTIGANRDGAIRGEKRVMTAVVLGGGGLAVAGLVLAYDDDSPHEMCVEEKP